MEEATWKVVVLILKWKRDYHIIGRMEVMWKVVAVIINFRITSSMIYHYFLHGLQSVCGTGTATLEVKLLQQLSSMS